MVETNSDTSCIELAASRFSEGFSCSQSVLVAFAPELGLDADAALRVSADSMFAGKSLAEIKMRKDYAVAVVAVRREAAVISNPDGDTRILAGDVLIAFGTPDRVAAVAALLNPAELR